MKKMFSKGLCALVSVALLASCGDASTDKATGSDSTAVATTGTDSTSKTGTEPDWKLGVQFWTFRNFPFTTALEKADSAGIKFIEAFPGQALGGEFKDTFNINMSPESRTKIKQMVAAKGMRIVAFGVTGAKDLAEWTKLFQFAKDMNLDYINSEPNKTQWNMIDSLSGVFGVKVSIHEHPKPNPYWHPDSVLAALKGHPNLYACGDLGHWGRSGLNPVECLQKLEGKLIGIHLKDIKKVGDTESEDLIVGTGALKYPEIFAELKRQNFKGMLSIERENNWDNNMPDVKQTAQYFNEQVKALK